MSKPLLILTGPTAVGKTEISIQLAKQCGGEIISADSMQVYKKMDIGTAKIQPEEMQGVPHYMIDELEPDEEFNVFIFQKKVKQYMKEIYERGHIPILVGGTGFYIQAVLYDIVFTENQKQDSYRKELQEMAQSPKGIHSLHEMLQKVDAASAQNIHENNVKRVIRALEYYHFTGEPFSVHNERERHRKSPYNFHYVVLTMDREKLYRRIDSRVDEMVKEGLVDEVKGLLDAGYKRDLVSMQGLGYKETAAYLEGECTLADAIYRLKRDTRHFAKRQLTWFRREKEVTFLNKDNYQDNGDIVKEIWLGCKKKGMKGDTTT